MIVLDASVVIDSLLSKMGDRYKSRKKDVNIVRRFVDELISEIELISEEKLIELSYNLAFVVKGRAVDYLTRLYSSRLFCISHPHSG